MNTSYTILAVSLFFTLFANLTFFRQVIAVYPFSEGYYFFIFTVFVNLLAAFIIIFNLIIPKHRYLFKPLLIFFLLTTSITSYFLDSLGIVFDTKIITNILETNLHEAIDLLGLKLLAYFLVLGVLPSIFIFFIKIPDLSFKQELKNRLKFISGAALISLTLYASAGKNYASFFREHKPLRYYTNPTYYTYSVGKFISDHYQYREPAFTKLGEDSKIKTGDVERELVIMVVGETARADRFSLNGYTKETNPELKKESLISFKNMSSCGTSTSVSVPCMFSNLTRANFSENRVRTTENLLDLLMHTKNVEILWRDNNYSSKGVADRVPYQDFTSRKLNPVCDVECRDEGMLYKLQEYVDSRIQKDVFIVLHQMGNHGPAYYKRYPQEFEKFKPVCKTNELDKCTNEEISNTYDNAILYTDYFLAKVIAFLKHNSEKFETALLYVSDHGESLGEKGVYLHSLPYLIAPKEQTNVAAILWLEDSLKQEFDPNGLNKLADANLSHDNIFHTILGLFEIETTTYRKDLDILAESRRE